MNTGKIIKIIECPEKPEKPRRSKSIPVEIPKRVKREVPVEQPVGV